MTDRTQDINSGTNPWRIAVLLAVLALLVRLPPALGAGFPLNDGGLFYQMMLDLQANQFRLPAFTTYNAAAIPFVYPPLGLYVGSALSVLLGIDPLVLLRVLPAIVSALCVPAFYHLARRVLPMQQSSVFSASVAFALIPRAFEWQVMGGGITRSFGMLFTLLTWRAAYKLFAERSPRQIASAGLWGGLTVLSHPEAASQAAFGALLLYLFLDRSRRGALYALCVAGLVALLAAPWWASALVQHGAGPFLAAARAAREGTTVDLSGRIFLAFQFRFSAEIYLPFVGVIALFGAFVEIYRRRFLLPLWLLGPLFFEPRGAPPFMCVPLAMLAGIGLMEVIIPSMREIAAKSRGPATRAPAALLVYLTVYILISAYVVTSSIANNVTLRASDLDAFAWVRENTPPLSRFAMITQQNALADPWAEWFPAVAQRQSLDTVFGTEWLENTSFRTKIMQYDSLQACIAEDEACLRTWEQDFGGNFTHVIIYKHGKSSVLLEALRRSLEFRLEYETADWAIFEHLGVSLNYRRPGHDAGVMRISGRKGWSYNKTTPPEAGGVALRQTG